MFLDFPRNLQLAIQPLALRDLAADGHGQATNLQRHARLGRDGTQQAQIGPGIRCLRELLSQAHEPDQFVFRRDRQQEFAMQFGQSAPLFVADVREAIDPGVGIVERTVIPGP